MVGEYIIRRISWGEKGPMFFVTTGAIWRKVNPVPNKMLRHTKVKIEQICDRLL